MAAYDFDLFTLGAGSGGVAASRRAAAYGPKVGICEGSRVGGTCVIRGCVPKKLLMYAGQFRDAFEDAVGYGWNAKVPPFDWQTLLHNKNAEIDRLNGIYIGMLQKAGVDVFEQRGRLLDAHTVQVGDRTVTAERILIATGGWPTRLDIPGIENTITSNELLELDSLPPSLIVLGGGYIGVEFASIFNALGVDVTVAIRGDQVLRGFDHDLRGALEVEMRKRGIRIETGIRPVRVDPVGSRYAITSADGRTLGAELILSATGRSPNTAALGLEAAGVAVDAKGAIVVDGWSRTTAANIYAVGDVTDRVALTPVAIAEGRALVETLYNDNPTQVGYDNVPTAVFTTPPIGSVGLTEAQARERFGAEAVDIYRTGFRPMKHTLSGRDERMLIKMVVDRASDRVLGCHMLGADAPEIVQGLAIALNCGATKRDFDRTIGLHPSAAEEFVTLREKVTAPA